MTICDKIQTVGETLESNLNARGVSCTFGTGTGEKNILQMTNLITSSNLKGSADSIISISASRPYLLSGEKTDLIVKLTNGLGEPKANASVTISDGTSLYSGITNNQGIFTVYDISVSSNTTFTATYGTISDSCLVEYCVWVDYGVSTRHSDHYYYTSNEGSVTITDNGTKVLNTTGNTTFVYLSPVPLDQTVSGNNRYKWNAPLAIEFDITESSGTANNETQVQVYSLTTGGNCDADIYSNDTGHWRIEMYDNNTQKIYLNGMLKKSTSLTLTDARIGLRAKNSKYLIYKNFRVKSL